MYKHSVGILSVFTAIFLALSFLSGCSLPTNGPTQQPGGQTPDALYTAAVQTVVAELTQAAVTSAPPTETLPTQPAALPSATPLPPTATQAPTATLTQQATQTSTATPTTNPTPTQVSTDPKLSLGDPTFQDTFQNDQNWSLAKDEHSDMYIKDGKLVMVALNADRWDSWALTWPKTENFYIELTATTHDCSGLDHYGLILRVKADATRGYLYSFSCDGKYSFKTWDGKKTTKLVDWTASSFILKGPNQINRIGVKAEGSTFSLYANGNLMTEVTDDTYGTGNFGVLIGAAETENFTTDVNEIAYWELP